MYQEEIKRSDVADQLGELFVVAECAALVQ